MPAGTSTSTQVLANTIPRVGKRETIESYIDNTYLNIYVLAQHNLRGYLQPHIGYTATAYIVEES